MEELMSFPEAIAKLQETLKMISQEQRPADEMRVTLDKANNVLVKNVYDWEKTVPLRAGKNKLVLQKQGVPLARILARNYDSLWRRVLEVRKNLDNYEVAKAEAQVASRLLGELETLEEIRIQK